ncbi:MAG: hypothetical protein ABH803_04460 [Candidatus Micrarchaeota archaeon]
MIKEIKTRTESLKFGKVNFTTHFSDWEFKNTIQQGVNNLFLEKLQEILNRMAKAQTHSLNQPNFAIVHEVHWKAAGSERFRKGEGLIGGGINTHLTHDNARGYPEVAEHLGELPQEKQIELKRKLKEYHEKAKRIIIKQAERF